LAEAAAEMGKVLSKWKFSHPSREEAAKRTLLFEGHLSHPVGMAVHDAGEYHGKPLQPGAVFALDPQMWIPEEQLYIRVEDTVVVTSEGIEILTAGVPLELEEIEEMMREEGLLQKMLPDEVLCGS
jgi:Xaa-Pro aminopeptidase